MLVPCCDLPTSCAGPWCWRLPFLREQLPQTALRAAVVCVVGRAQDPSRSFPTHRRRALLLHRLSPRPRPLCPPGQHPRFSLSPDLHSARVAGKTTEHVLSPLAPPALARRHARPLTGPAFRVEESVLSSFSLQPSGQAERVLPSQCRRSCTRIAQNLPAARWWLVRCPCSVRGNSADPEKAAHTLSHAQRTAVPCGQDPSCHYQSPGRESQEPAVPQRLRPEQPGAPGRRLCGVSPRTSC